MNKEKILKNICYTELVYERIRKKLKIDLPNKAIEEMIAQTIEETPIVCFESIGKNYYISNIQRGIKITINSNTTRVITVDKI
ncbi:MAG: DUF3781 domain-containing protein [Spirochaetales bacterium]|nr:DUF3781 domain-containing protein [Spirochaetales bacterium]